MDTLNFNALLDEIESGSSGSYANVIRKLREHEVAAYHAGVGGPTGELVASFISALDNRAAERNSEIEKTCSHHYQGFVDSTRELLRIQQSAEKLQLDMDSLNVHLGKIVDEFQESCDKLAECKLTMEHIDQCIESIQISLPILDQYSRVEQSIAEGRFYHALKTLEDLEHSHLDLIRPFAFSEIIINHIPKTRASIKQASLAELTDFLEQIRKNSVILGAMAMREAAQAAGMDGDAFIDSISASTVQPKISVPSTSSLLQEKMSAVSTNSKNVKTKYDPTLDGLENELNLLGLILNGPVNSEIPEELLSVTGQKPSQAFLNAENLVDFGPVYRCLHIHSALKERVEFERHYCTQRRKQCQLSLSLSPNQQANMRNYGEFFSGICGFFVVDDYLRHTIPGSSAFYQTYLDELWGSTVNRLVDFARSNALACSCTNDLVRLKDYSIIFEQTMQSLGFPTAGLSEMIAYIQRRFHHLLVDQWRDRFETILNEDNYQPIKLENQRDVDSYIILYPPGNTVEFNELAFPRQLCFSWMVPKIYKAIRDFIDSCYQFCNNMNLSCTELEDTVNRATNTLFTDCLNVVLQARIRKFSHTLSRLTQFCINLDELETAYGHLDHYLQYSLLSDADRFNMVQCKDEFPLVINGRHSTTLNTGTNPPRSQLHGASLLKDIRALVESLIYTHLNESVAEFINLSVYDDEDLDEDEKEERSKITNKKQLGKALSLTDLRTENANQNGLSVSTRKPSENIVNLTKWLKTTFETFSNLPPKVAQTACISVCKHIARLLYDVLFGTQVRSLSEFGLQQLSVDLTQCEVFARSQPVPGLNPITLWLIFADLRQLLDLFHKDDWSAYIASRKKSDGSPYDRVPPSVAIKLLERVREAEKRRTNFLQAMRKEERGRRKKIEDVIRQLRDLNANVRTA